MFRKLLYKDDSHKNHGGIIGKTMTQNSTKNDKQEQCDTKHNAMKINLTRKITPYPVPPRTTRYLLDLPATSVSSTFLLALHN